MVTVISGWLASVCGSGVGGWEGGVLEKERTELWKGRGEGATPVPGLFLNDRQSGRFNPAAVNADARSPSAPERPLRPAAPPGRSDRPLRSPHSEREPPLAFLLITARLLFHRSRI